MTVERMLAEMSGPEIDMWFAFYEIEAEERNQTSAPAPFDPTRRTLRGS
jgi:hypothetical protein